VRRPSLHIPTAAALCAAFLLAAHSHAARAAEPDQPLTAEEFDALSVGRTMYYESEGKAYGAEQYLPGRRVVWAFLGDDCLKGTWYPEGQDICFVYEDRPDPQCWTFYQSEKGLIAHFRGNPDGAPLVGVQQSPAPLACLGPDVGV
jgi:hypothetical protein